jgi:hypothetical protein
MRISIRRGTNDAQWHNVVSVRRKGAAQLLDCTVPLLIEGLQNIPSE